MERISLWTDPVHKGSHTRLRLCQKKIKGRSFVGSLKVYEKYTWTPSSLNLQVLGFLISVSYSISFHSVVKIHHYINLHGKMRNISTNRKFDEGKNEIFSFYLWCFLSFGLKPKGCHLNYISSTHCFIRTGNENEN